MKYNDYVYKKSYYERNRERSSWFHRTLKYQDSFPALCFALGLADTYDKALEYVNLTRKDSLNFEGNLHVGAWDSDKSYSLWDSTGIRGIAIEEQLACLRSNMKRTPKGVLDIGIGRGETSLVLSHLGIPTIGLEPAPNAGQMIQETSEFWKLDPTKVSLISTLEELREKDLSSLDTVIFCCSIEHIYRNHLYEMLDLVSEPMRRNQGLLITTNTIDQYPLPVDGHDHVELVNNSYYQAMVDRYQLSTIYHETNMYIGKFA